MYVQLSWWVGLARFACMGVGLAGSAAVDGIILKILCEV